MSITTTPFKLGQYMRDRQIKTSEEMRQRSDGDMSRFLDVATTIQNLFMKRAEMEGQTQGSDQELARESMRRQKRAIIGYEADVAYYKDRIKDYLDEMELSKEWYPYWYDSLEDAIFHEIWGLAGMSAWCYDTRPEYKYSSSAKIIGDKIYYYIDGKMQLQPQTISYDRRHQLKRALLLQTPNEREGVGEHEVYMKNGIRITIFTDHYVKSQEEETIDVFVFRKYILPTYSLKQQVEMKTIPPEAKDLLSCMCKVGFNVNFTGAVRSGKTTMMACYQMEEDPTREGLMIETDPELPLHKLMPNAPIVQILADDADLEEIIKPLLRADPEYIIMAEARDATAFYVALDITDRGTRRSKLTTHFSSGKDLPSAMAKKIAEKYGGNQFDIACKIARNINYVIEMVSLPGKGNEKRLKGIYELRYDMQQDQISCHQICRYDFLQDTWTWRFDLGEDKRQIGMEGDWDAFCTFESLLKELGERFPMEGESIFYPKFHTEVM